MCLLFIGFKNMGIKIAQCGIELCSDPEEADTRIILHAKHAKENGSSIIIISSEHTDVCILCIAHNDVIF